MRGFKLRKAVLCEHFQEDVVEIRRVNINAGSLKLVPMEF